MRKTYKKLIALCAVLIFVLALIPTTSFADPFTSAIVGLGGASSAGLFGAVSAASGADLDISNLTLSQADNFWNSNLEDGISISGTTHKGTGGSGDEYDYITLSKYDGWNRVKDYVNDSWYVWNLSDNSSGNISSEPNCSGFSEGSFIGAVYAPFSIGQSVVNGPFEIRIVSYGSGGKSVALYYNGTSKWSYNNISDSYQYFIIHMGHFITGDRWTINYTYVDALGNQQTRNSGIAVYGNGVISTPFETGVLNYNFGTQFNEPVIKIPSTSTLSQGFTVGEFLGALTQEVKANGYTNIVIEDNSPEPVPTPIPTDSLGDIPFDEWYDLFGLPVLDGQEEIHQDLQDFSEQVQDGTVDIVGELDDIESDVESIDTNLGIGNGLLGDLKSIGQSIQSTLSSILSGVTDLVQEIVLSTETFIAGLLNSIMGGLGGWLSTMREAFSIWHYVVEWIGSISTVFSWFWSVAGSTSYYIQLPIYASLAGAVVLAFYKRFGK